MGEMRGEVVEREAVLPGETVDTSSESAEKEMVSCQYYRNSVSSSQPSSSGRICRCWTVAVGGIGIDMENR